ncbi:MAG TPA: GNAT family N-acetyltransferase [Chthoniobacterales bacterium]|nr:GNAT family N-acetyltransferase [Chthoniobacterales bacterium]
MIMKISEARHAGEIARCFPVMRQLRPHFDDEKTFAAQVEGQRRAGYRMAFAEDDAGAVRAVAGYRFLESLHAGRFCYVDDLVTDESARSLGFGGALFDWLVAEARAAGCAKFELDSGVQRFAAHRFYLAKRMIISSHHFSLEL